MKFLTWLLLTSFFDKTQWSSLSVWCLSNVIKVLYYETYSTWGKFSKEVSGNIYLP